jgi:hypothetical protein
VSSVAFLNLDLINHSCVRDSWSITLSREVNTRQTCSGKTGPHCQGTGERIISSGDEECKFYMYFDYLDALASLIELNFSEEI